MTARDVRKTIVSFIVQNIGLSTPGEVDMAASSISTATTVNDLGQSTHGMSESVMSEASVPEQALLDPIYVHSYRELEDAFRDMQPVFEGRETEHNWSPRDKSIRKIRQFLQGNAPSDFHAVFIAGIISMRDNILKVCNTLRTTMSTNACQLVQEMYRTLGSAMDPMTEIFVQNFIKMSATTKHIAAKNADTTMEIILSHCAFSQRLLNHVWQSFGDKNMQTRSFAPSWLKVLMMKNASHKSHMEHNGGIDVIEKCLKKGLEDPTPKVRESTRGAYWVFAQLWPDHAQRLVIHVKEEHV
jgi:CLIP-associating protein 1/2